MKKPVWGSQPKGLKIKSAYKPQGSNGFSGVAWIIMGKKTGWFPIKVPKESIKKIQKCMPLPISLKNGCYLKVVAYVEGYRVYCSYIDKPGQIYLWRQKDEIYWVKRVRYGI